MIITLSGSNHFMINNELKNIINGFVENNSDMAVEQIDGSESDLQAITESFSNLSFLTPNRLIILKRGSGNKQFIDSAEKLIDNVPSTNTVVIVEPNIDKRLGYYKALKKLTDFKNYDELEFGQLAKWIDETVTQQGGVIKNNEARYLVEIVGLDQLRLSSEITKLLSYHGTVTKETIDLLVVPTSQTTIFQLLDAVFTGKSKELLKIYDDQKKQKVEPQQIIAMLTWQVHILAMINAAGNKPPAEIAKITRVSPFVINKSLGIAKRMNKQDIQNLTRSLLELDIKLKNKTVDADEALLQLLLTITN
jgi:DNA polymerase III delta subunit